MKCCTVIALLLVSGCAGSGSKSTAKIDEVISSELITDQENKLINKKILASAGKSEGQEYVLGEGDLIQVMVFEAEELKAETRVGAQGVVTLPLLGPVNIRGMTSQQAGEKIADLYREKYIHDPHVNVFIKEQVSGRITLLGSLHKPGTYNYLTKQRLLDALALAEGLSEKAGRTAQVRRAGNNPEHAETLLIDLDQMLKDGHSELNVEIRSGDVIYVPEAGTVYVDGAVRKPGNYPIFRSMTVHEAIVTAGGFSKIASSGNIKIARMDGTGKRKIVRVNAKNLQAGPAGELTVKDRDVIVVEANLLRSLVYGLRLNMGGLMGVGYDPPSN